MRRTCINRRKKWSVAGLAACLFFAVNVQASTVGLTVSFQEAFGAPGDTGDSFDVLVTNSGTEAVTVAGFGFGFSISDTDIMLTDATTATTDAPYIFAGNSFFSPDILVSTDGQSLSALDIYSGSDPGVILNPGDVFALGNILFNVASSAVPGEVPTTWNSSSAVTNFSDSNGAPIAIDSLINGEITVTPEPATLWVIPAAWVVLQSALATKRRWALRTPFPRARRFTCV